MTLADARKLNDAYDKLKEAQALVEAIAKRCRSEADRAELAKCLESIDEAQKVLA